MSSYPTRSNVGQSNTFKDRVLGPYKIIKIFNEELNYLIVGLNNKKIHSIHYNSLLPYIACNENEFKFDQIMNEPHNIEEINRSENYFNFEVDDG